MHLSIYSIPDTYVYIMQYKRKPFFDTYKLQQFVIYNYINIYNLSQTNKTNGNDLLKTIYLKHF